MYKCKYLNIYNYMYTYKYMYIYNYTYVQTVKTHTDNNINLFYNIAGVVRFRRQSPLMSSLLIIITVFSLYSAHIGGGCAAQLSGLSWGRLSATNAVRRYGVWAARL
eukprot:GHVS01089005.1.p1 GENE.GHVS01089005.1~~GHVS01089005.1.p1  ORF type:complete len:107 (-),score=1.57 GHVS01089005.1:199-519(-)